MYGNLRYSFILFIVYLGSANSQASDVWLHSHSPIKVGITAEKRNQTQLWFHRPSQASFVDAREDFMPGLPKAIRLRAYCKSLKSHYSKVTQFQETAKACVVSGIFLDHSATEAAIVGDTREMRHFASDTRDVKGDHSRLLKDLGALLERVASK